MGSPTNTAQGSAICAESIVTVPLAIVIEKRRIRHVWQEWAWEPVAVLLGRDGESDCGETGWRELRRDADRVLYLTTTLPLSLHRADTESYLANLHSSRPCVYVVLRSCEDSEWAIEPFLVTASAYEGQDYTDSGEEIVAPVPLPDELRYLITEFTDIHHKEQAFIKRRRDRVDVEKSEDGKGDSRIRQAGDVYRAPTRGVKS